MSWHEAVLNIRQRNVLRRLGPVMTTASFYLAGGTALALQLGHRHSVDLDWFTDRVIPDGMALAHELRTAGVPLTVRRTDRGTLHAVASQVRCSFLEFRYPLLQPLVECEQFDCLVASLDDLACMKLSAMAQRGSKKDFVDLYALVSRHRPLSELLEVYQRKFAVRDIMHVVLGLCYFGDAGKERMPRMRWKVDWKTIRRAVQQWSRELAG